MLNINGRNIRTNGVAVLCESHLDQNAREGQLFATNKRIACDWPTEGSHKRSQSKSKCEIHHVPFLDVVCFAIIRHMLFSFILHHCDL
jgi:hypothetical protein